MRQWDQLIEGHARICATRGLSPDLIQGRRRELERWGQWQRQQEPSVRMEALGQAEIIAYIRARSAFHSKSTIASVMSHMRCFGEHLVIESVWQQNPLRWLRSPRIVPVQRCVRHKERYVLKSIFR